MRKLMNVILSERSIWKKITYFLLLINHKYKTPFKYFLRQVPCLSSLWLQIYFLCKKLRDGILIMKSGFTFIKLSARFRKQSTELLLSTIFLCSTQLVIYPFHLNRGCFERYHFHMASAVLQNIHFQFLPYFNYRHKGRNIFNFVDQRRSNALPAEIGYGTSLPNFSRLSSP